MDGSLLNGLDLFSLYLSQGVVPHWNTVLKYWPYNSISMTLMYIYVSAITFTESLIYHQFRLGRT